VSLARELHHEPILAAALWSLGNLASLEGDPVAAEGLHREALAIRRRLNPQGPARHVLASTLISLGQALLAQGAADAAAACLSEAEGIARELDATMDLVQALFHLGGVARSRHDFVEAERRYRESLERAQTLGSQRWILLAHLGLAQAGRDQSDGRGAANQLVEALATARAHGEVWSLGRWFRGTVCLLLDAPALLGLPAARESLRAALSLPRGPGFAPLTRLLAAVAASPQPVASLARTEDFADASATARAALGDDAFGAHWQEGARLSIEDVLRDALAGTRAPRRHGALTQREWEIASLVSVGRSNTEIARALVLSARTVERHIENIYAKLGIHGPPARAALTAYVLRRSDPADG